jgi:iron complex outermembrane receptor protein
MKSATALYSASRIALVAAIGLASSYSTALAQPAANQGSTVEEVVVTAQFREQNLQDTPIAITAVTGEMLQARSQTDISQVANQAPNVTLKPQGAAFGPSLGASIRGIGQYDFNPALEPGVGVYVDDVYYATLTGSIFDLLDLERVEILRGPQGTLAGRNSIGGAVKLYSKRPTGDGSGYASVAFGSRNRMDLRAGADFGLAENLSRGGQAPGGVCRSPRLRLREPAGQRQESRRRRGGRHPIHRGLQGRR